MKKPTPAQLAARARFAEMARSGAFKRKAKTKSNPRKKTVSQKISQLVHEGYPQKQAVAVALSEQRRGKVKRNPVGNVANLKKRYNTLLTTIAGLRDDQKRRAAGLPDELEGYTDAEIKKLISMYQAKASDLREAINMYQRNPATGHKGSHVKLNPVKPVPGHGVYEVAVKRTATSKWSPVARFVSFSEAEDYSHYLAKRHPAWTIRVLDTRAM